MVDQASELAGGSGQQPRHQAPPLVGVGDRRRPRRSSHPML